MPKPQVLVENARCSRTRAPSQLRDRDIEYARVPLYPGFRGVPDMTDTLLDWTQGTAGIAYQQCPGCQARWAFRRTFCPRCGRPGPDDCQASGDGVVHAVTTVARAPTEEFRALAPYVIVLVDLVEGPRIMAHGTAGLAIGDHVRAGYLDVAGRVLPRFERA